MTTIGQLTERLNIRCMYGDGKRVTKSFAVPGHAGLILMVCTPCANSVKAKHATHRCPYCGTPSKHDHKRTTVGDFAHLVGCKYSVQELLEVAVPE